MPKKIDRSLFDLDKISYLFEVEDLSQEKIANITGCSRTTIMRIVKEFGIKKKRIGQRHREDSPNWKGGIRNNKYGYVRIYAPDHPNAMKDKYVLAHRLEMEKHIGRFLFSSEVVHHIDGDRSNNDISNLSLCSSLSEHSRMECFLSRTPEAEKAFRDGWMKYNENRREYLQPGDYQKRRRCSSQKAYQKRKLKIEKLSDM